VVEQGIKAQRRSTPSILVAVFPDGLPDLWPSQPTSWTSSRVPGASQATIWHHRRHAHLLKPDHGRTRHQRALVVTPSGQNQQFAVGQLGQPPTNERRTDLTVRPAAFLI
jgi:hypothetical protein